MKSGIVEFCGGKLPSIWLLPPIRNTWNGGWKSQSAPQPYQVGDLLSPSARRALDDLLSSYESYDLHPAWEYVCRRCVLDLVLGRLDSGIAWEKLSAWMSPCCLVAWTCLSAEIAAERSSGCSNLGWLCCLD